MVKKFLIMRHGPSIKVVHVCSLAWRLRLIKNARRSNFLGEGAISVFTAPEWDTQYTANRVAQELKAAKPTIETTLSDEREDEPVSETFVRARLADLNPDIFMTHFKRMDPAIAAIEKASGIKLKVDGARMRHLNRAYLVDLENGRVLVIKEKD